MICDRMLMNQNNYIQKANVCIKMIHNKNAEIWTRKKLRHSNNKKKKKGKKWIMSSTLIELKYILLNTEYEMVPMEL